MSGALDEDRTGTTPWAVPGGAVPGEAVPGSPPAAGPVATGPVDAGPVDAGPVDAGPGGEGTGPRNPWERPPDPRWTRPALAALLLGTALAYLWDLGRNGMGNTFYAAAVQSGTKSWSSFFFGSSDWGDFITVDKPPASLWIMELSGRVFGFSSWSMLAPEALLGVASVALLFGAVRRVWGAPAGLLSGLLLALTPAAALMFRFNNPDAALTFLLVAAAYAVTRAMERGSTRWLLLTAALVGTAFLAKSLQALLVVPGLGLAYLVAAPGTWLRRAWQTAAALAVLVVSGLWWPVLVDALPAGSRPYVGGSTDDTVLQLALGYNGLDRITGTSGPGGGGGPGGGPGGGGGGGFGGAPGLSRLFNDEFAGFVAWLIPAALIGLAAGVWLTVRARRADPRWGSLVLWGGWALVTGGVLSAMSGIVHSYYTVALAPGVAALAGMVVPPLWRRRAEVPARAALALMATASAGTAYVLLGRDAGWQPWLRVAVLVAGLAGAAGLLIGGSGAAGGGTAGGRGRRLLPRMTAVAGVLALGASVAGPAAWSAATVGSTHTGSIPTVGPAGARTAAFGRGAGGFGGRFDRPGGAFPGGEVPGGAVPGGAVPGGAVPGGAVPGGAVPGGGAFPGGAFPGGAFPGGAFPGGGFPGGAGGPGGEGTTDAALVSLLKQGAAGFRWVAAAPSSMTAGPLQLAADAPVMALGGFSGGDPAITLAAFQADVAAHRVHYFVGAGSRSFGGGAGRGGEGGTSAIATWVAATFTARTVGSTTVYDLTAPVAGG